MLDYIHRKISTSNASVFYEINQETIFYSLLPNQYGKMPFSFPPLAFIRLDLFLMFLSTVFSKLATALGFTMFRSLHSMYHTLESILIIQITGSVANSRTDKFIRL